MVSICDARIVNFRQASVLAAGLVWIGSVWAVEARPTRYLADSGKRPTPQATIPLDRQTEERAIELVESHLPDLNDVLKRLRADQARDYDEAIRDLAKSARKLEAARNRDERLYEIELELLKAQSQVHLLMAKLKVRDSHSDRKQLRISASRLQQAQLARGDYDVQLLTQRLERTRQQFVAAKARLEAKRDRSDEQLEKSYLSMLRKAGREPKQE